MKVARVFLLASSITFGVVGMGNSEEPVPEAKTVGEFLALGQLEAARSKVLYCDETAPSLKAEFDDAFRAYQGKFREAMQPILDRIKSVPVFSGRVPPGLTDAFAAQQAQDLAETRKHNPKEYCSWFLSTLKQTTPDSIRRVSEESLSRWQEAMGNTPKR
jgi:hypothetical protein